MKFSDDKAVVDQLMYDFTPPDLISFFITDLKIYKPPAISDEMIKLHNC